MEKTSDSPHAMQLNAVLDCARANLLTLASELPAAGQRLRLHVALNAVGSVEFEVDHGKAARGDMLQLLLDAEAERLGALQLVSDTVPAVAGVLPFKLAKMFDYAIAYCTADNDCPDGQFDLDCTHFLCHCLNNAGVRITSPAAQCQSGLCIRVNDFAAAIDNAVSKYSNVKRIASYDQTRRGDICFIPKWFGLRVEHAMLLAGPATAKGAPVYAHTNRHCGDKADFDASDCKFYRIEDA